MARKKRMLALGYDENSSHRLGLGDEKIFELAGELFHLRDHLGFSKTCFAWGEKDGGRNWDKMVEEGWDINSLLDREKKLTEDFHRLAKEKENGAVFSQIVAEARLDLLEREILVATLINSLGIFRYLCHDVENLVQILCRPKRTKLTIVRKLNSQAKLFRTGILFFSGREGDLRERRLEIDEEIQEKILLAGTSPFSVLNAKNEGELFTLLSFYFQAQEQKVENLDSRRYGRNGSGELEKLSRRVERFLDRFLKTLDLHPSWKIAKLWENFRACSRDKIRPAWRIFLILLGKEKGYLHPKNEIFTGLGLARVASRTAEEVPERLDLLKSNSFLLNNDWVQPCAGRESLFGDDANTLQDTEFELTDHSLEILEIKRNVMLQRKPRNDSREARVSLDCLVLKPSVLKALDLALKHVEQKDLLFQKWKLGDYFPYGRGMTMLFSGPPGTGKTACAEGLAHQLKKKILVADYSRIQNCFVGQTEKNIVRLFAEAKKTGAILFWDEADAMFYDRDAASKTWEVRDVNVLLQEVENFDGICILATNRRITLDRALARRISIKIEFDLPNRAMRREIIRKLLPPVPPLQSDLELDWLAAQPFSGGQIKNLVLNAVRLAAARGGVDAVLTREDFEESMRMGEEMDWAAKKITVGFMNGIEGVKHC